MFLDNGHSGSLEFKTNKTGRIGNDGPENVNIRVSLKYLTNFWRTLDCEINLILNCSARCFVMDNPIAGQEPIFEITDTKLYLLVVT